MNQQHAAPGIPLWLIWLAAFVFVLAGLGGFGILDNNEGLYAEIPREMLASGDWRMWVIPHLNGLPYMEKPPLLYWLTALSFALLGESEWSARLVPALSALACVAALICFGQAVKRPNAGRLAALMFISGIGAIAMSHVLMFDMLLTALLTAALMCAYRYIGEEEVRFIRRSYAFLALALLAKGLVALVLFGLIVGGFTLMTSRSVPGFFRACGKWFEPWAAVILIAIAAPWHIVASLTEPVFAWFYFINEHVLRFLGKREPHDYYAGSWWYYLPRMAIYLFPWSFLLPCLLARGQRMADWDSNRLQKFMMMAWLAPVLFFSISSAKANYYLVAVMPFAALHLAVAIENRNFFGGAARVVPGLLIAVLAGLLCVAVVIRTADSAQTITIWGLPQSQFVFVTVGVLAVMALGCAIVAWRKPAWGILSYLLLPLWIAFVLLSVLKAIEPTVSTLQMAQYLQGEMPGKKVYLYRNFEEQSSLPFYLKKPVPIIDARSNDLFWGDKLRAGNDIVISAERFASLPENQPVAVVVMDRQLIDFKSAGFFKRFKGEKRIGGSTVFFN